MIAPAHLPGQLARAGRFPIAGFFQGFVPMPMIRSNAASLDGFYRRHAGWLAVVAVLGLSACASVRDRLPAVGSVVTPYKIDVQQGNVVTREQVQALRVGMPRQQVRDILGSPLLTSVFHANRWDYAFSFRRQGQPLQQRHVAVFFQGDVLARVEADELPTEAELVSTLDARRPTEEAPPLVATEEQLKAFAARNAPASATNGAAAGAQPPVAYPPLEASGAAR